MLIQCLRGQGRQIPPHFDLADPEARRGTTYVRAVDTNLLVALDRERSRQEGRPIYTLLGPSRAYGGWVPYFEIADDHGRPLPSPVPWHDVSAALHKGRAEGETAAQRVEEHNRRLDAQRREAARDYQRETAKYVRNAVAREWAGNSPWQTQDVLQGLAGAMGNGATFEAPKARPLVSLPGEATRGGSR